MKRKSKARWGNHTYTHIKVRKSKHRHASHTCTHSPVAMHWHCYSVRKMCDSEWRWIWFSSDCQRVSLFNGSKLMSLSRVAFPHLLLSCVLFLFPPPLHCYFCFSSHLSFPPSPAVVVCGLQGRCVSAGPVSVWAVWSGLRWVLPGQRPLLHLGRTRLQPLHAHRTQVGTAN